MERFPRSWDQKLDESTMSWLKEMSDNQDKLIQELSGEDDHPKTDWQRECEFVDIEDVIHLHQKMMMSYIPMIRDQGLLESSLSQPYATFDGEELYPDVEDKAAALCYNLIQNHPFTDGNKRIAHLVMASLLWYNYRTDFPRDYHSHYEIILSVARGETDREGLLAWIKENYRSCARTLEWRNFWTDAESLLESFEEMYELLA